jgi:hypothetical protein
MAGLNGVHNITDTIVRVGTSRNTGEYEFNNESVA